jgi:hypothetical protein
VALVGSILAPVPLSAQQETEEPPQVREGSTVRIQVLQDPSVLSRLYPHRVYEGTVTSYTANSLVLTPTKPLGLDTFELPWTDIERLDLGVPMQGRFWSGALIGGPAVGAGLALIGMAACSGEACAFGDLTSGEAALLMGGIGFGVGFVLGGIVSANSERTGWEEIPIEGVRLQAGGDGTGLALSIPLSLFE